VGAGTCSFPSSGSLRLVGCKLSSPVAQETKLIDPIALLTLTSEISSALAAPCALVSSTSFADS